MMQFFGRLFWGKGKNSALGPISLPYKQVPTVCVQGGFIASEATNVNATHSQSSRGLSWTGEDMVFTQVCLMQREVVSVRGLLFRTRRGKRTRQLLFLAACIVGREGLNEEF